MNRSDLANHVSEATGLTKAAADKAVGAVFAAIEEALKRGEDVRLMGFGSFSLAERAAREGKNPRTGEPVQIAAAKQPRFQAGKGLKDALNE